MTTKADREQLREIVKQERLEVRLERWAIPRIQRELSRVYANVLIEYQRGGIERVDFLMRELFLGMPDVLNNIYDKTINAVSIMMEKGSALFKETKGIFDIKDKIVSIFKEQAKKVTNYLKNSTTRKVRAIVKRGFEDDLTNDEIADEIKKKLKIEEKRRAVVIAETEIGAASAETRDEIAKINLAGQVVKEWVTRGDSKVRHSHEDANGQSVLVASLFTLYGRRVETCPYPRYRGLSPAQKINCRCKAKYLTVEN